MSSYAKANVNEYAFFQITTFRKEILSGDSAAEEENRFPVIVPPSKIIHL